MLFDNKLDRHLMDYNYIGRYFHWRDAEHAMLFKDPSVYSERWEKRISESHEQWKRDFGIDCDSAHNLGVHHSKLDHNSTASSPEFQQACTEGRLCREEQRCRQ